MAEDCGCNPKPCEREHRVVGPINKNNLVVTVFACVRCGAKFAYIGFPTVEEFNKILEETVDAKLA